ncbi:MAG: tRNA (N6-isopentenyl adenosine(37)-C2)-methylthiotransferase MiaB [Marinilabiliales bacterium]|nr:MAG: tRNA (N6-isopentenyl adenosine(37)-C2)-methylthiotransferase MiaB [Marinilabiliales bacterium]
MKRLYIETYGCQMNVADSEVVASILKGQDYIITENDKDADLILINTCSIRENAEQKIWGRIKSVSALKKKKPGLLFGIIGCMAERLKEELIEKTKVVDIVVGPDAYRDIPKLVEEASSGQKAINVLLSQEETYADISPVRVQSNGVSAFVSIMRGCNNMCSYCIVPYVRGRERSRPAESILGEVQELIGKGYKEVTLLGQNVNSYCWENENQNIDFPDLLKGVADLSPKLRVRFATSHPKDMSDKLLKTIAGKENICNFIHLPVQSGSTEVLSKMNRKYTREWYLGRIEAIQKYIPNCAISTDVMVGFCDETEENHQDTVSLMKQSRFDYAYMFKYSDRPGTYASKKMQDNIPEEIKSKRLTEIIELQNKISEEVKKECIGKTYEVLVEGYSKRSSEHLFGRNQQNQVVVFPKGNFSAGDYVFVKINNCTSATLIGEIADD